MNTVLEVHIEWKYTPNNYIEEEINITDTGFELSMLNGIALAKIEPSFYENNPDIETHIESLINNRLQAIQLISHSDFETSKPERKDLRKDGKFNIFMRLEPAVLTCTMHPVDFTHKDKYGHVISDTKQERLDKQNWLYETITKYRCSDRTLDHILSSQKDAAKDSENELVHLYEIRDAFVTRFGGKKNAINQLKITGKEWDELGDLANNQPLKEGRHRGKSAGLTRPATKNELERARNSASNLIEKYLIYLETQKIIT